MVAFKKSHKASTLSLNALPNDLLVEISSCVAAASVSEICNLRLVSKSFNKFCDDRYVVKRLCLNEVPFFSWDPENNKKNSRPFNKCLRNGNPEALYRNGLVNLFRLENDNEFRMYSAGEVRRGFIYLAKAADKGNQKALYVYGLSLICLGDQARKQKGFKVLSSLQKPLLSSTLKEMKKLRVDIRDKIFWRGEPVMRLIKSKYVREKCNCDGLTNKFLEKDIIISSACGWSGYGEKRNDIITSSACEICLWDHEVKLFFADIEK